MATDAFVSCTAVADQVNNARLQHSIKFIFFFLKMNSLLKQRSEDGQKSTLESTARIAKFNSRIRFLRTFTVSFFQLFALNSKF